MQQQVNGISAFRAACFCGHLTDVLEQHGDLGLRKRIGEGCASPQALLQIHQRESRVDGQKGPFGIGGIQDHLWSTVSPKTIA